MVRHLRPTNAVDEMRSADHGRAGHDLVVEERERLILFKLMAYLLESPDWSATVLNVGTGLLCANRI